MALEVGTWVEDLVVTNPASTDQKSQGDDHLRLIKTVLKNQFKNTSGKAVYLPKQLFRSANYIVLVVDDKTVFRCDTSAGSLTLTLPILTAGDVGWSVTVVKATSDANAVYLTPSATTINGFATVRRGTQFVRTEVLWDGTEYVASRPNGHIVGEVIEYYGAALPPGHLWCDGALFSAGVWPELNSVLGTTLTPDLRGRVSAGRDSMGIGAAGRLGVFIVGNVLGSGGGSEATTVTAGGFTSGGVTAITSITPAVGGTFSTLQPTLICNKILVGE